MTPPPDKFLKRGALSGIALLLPYLYKVKGKNTYKKRTLLRRPERYPIVFNHCMWVVFRFALDNAKEEEREELTETMEELYSALLDSVDEHGL